MSSVRHLAALAALLVCLLLPGVAGAQLAGPTAQFSADPVEGTVPLGVEFTDESIALLGATYEWDFGDGARSTDANPFHIYSSPGVYTVSLTVTDTSGSDTETKTDLIAVNAAPTTSFTVTPSSGKAPLAVQFDDTSDDSDGTFTRHWDFGDRDDPDTSDQSSESDPSYTYDSAGVYTARLTVTDDDGATATHAVEITVGDPNARPTASFTASSLTGPAPFEPTFTSTATDGDGTIASRRWDFGDGTTGSGASVSHRYTAPGTYTVKHTVTDDDGASATATKTVGVTIPPESVPDAPAGPTLQKLLTDLLLETPGPCSVRMLTASSLVICGGDKRRRLALRTWAVNAGAAPAAATVSGVERMPRVKRKRRRAATSAKARRVRYRTKRGTVPAYGSQKFRMKPPKKLRRKIRRALKRKGRVRRKAVLTLQVGDATAKMPHKVKLRAKKRSR